MTTDNDPLLTLEQIAKRCPAKTTRGHITVQTVRLWCLRGIGGVMLRYERGGKTLFVRESAWAEFNAQLDAIFGPSTQAAYRSTGKLRQPAKS